MTQDHVKRTSEQKGLLDIPSFEKKNVIKEALLVWPSNHVAYFAMATGPNPTGKMKETRGETKQTDS